MSITVDGEIREYKDKVRAIDLIDAANKNIITCRVNNKLRDLSYYIEDNSVVEFLSFDDEDSMRVYEASLRYLFVMAAYKVYPLLKVNCDYFVSRSICFRVSDGNFSEEQFNKIREEMMEIVKADYSFVRKNVDTESAKRYYESKGYYDKIDVFKYRPESEVHMYECDDYCNYMYSYMVPSTSYLSKYNLIYRNGVIVLQYPRSDKGGEIPEFVEEKTYEETLRKASEWGKEIGSLTVKDINDNVVRDTKGFIEKCEKRHDDLIEQVVNDIYNKKIIKLIAIAGPSSSGKTTFSNKLRVGLEKKGIYPVKISMDDYYLDRSGLTPEEERTIDYEDINLIDIPLFNKHLKELTEGKEVTLPYFDFISKTRKVGKTIKLENNAPIIIEGIHALNERLTESLARENKYEIYIGPHIQINLDDHNPISITHLRLIRRLVRDYKFRGSDVSRTLLMWDNVRRGEFKWIYENQEGVDFVYNSVLDYEFCVMKKYAIPLLKAVKEDASYYNLSRTLIKYFKYFVDIEDKDIPETSLLREFIGDSCFKE